MVSGQPDEILCDDSETYLDETAGGQTQQEVKKKKNALTPPPPFHVSKETLSETKGNKTVRIECNHFESKLGHDVKNEKNKEGLKRLPSVGFICRQNLPYNWMPDNHKKAKTVAATLYSAMKYGRPSKKTLFGIMHGSESPMWMVRTTKSMRGPVLGAHPERTNWLPRRLCRRVKCPLLLRNF
ncbi:hypothetical protein JTE90_006819 [Oedothorax gibbosus]|uniref:Uncharacterized protein n=1 Tax=Oedothorax gibbosus TaxID=931172 RepID=A0AAV6TQN5_9ARAC|nr:hypothetical protein JTE90_006819 [Oedothorax gibbosus]